MHTHTDCTSTSVVIKDWVIADPSVFNKCLVDWTSTTCSNGQTNQKQELAAGSVPQATQKEKKMNNLDTIMSAMRTGKYGTIVDPNGNVHVGIINGILREDGSGKNWIVTVTNQTASKKVFIYAK